MDISTGMYAPTHVDHYCRSCKRAVPLAPGISIQRYFTIGVHHATLAPHGLGGLPCSGVEFRKYSPDEQLRNLEELLDV